MAIHEFKYGHDYMMTIVFDKVEEYSAFTQQELPHDLYITVDGMESSEVLSSPSGSIVYFSSPIEGKLEAGVFYTCTLSRFSVEAWKTQLVAATNKFIEELRNKLK